MEAFIRFLNYILLPFLKRKSKLPAPLLIDLKMLAAIQDLHYLPTIKYAHDPVPHVPHYIRPSTLTFPQHASKVNDMIFSNSVRLKPQAAGLPYRSSLDYVRASKYWGANLDETLKAYRLIAAETSVVEVKVGNGISLSGLAQKELRPGLEYRTVHATSYMFPGGDEQRIRAIATLMVMLFVFDDKLEEAEGATLSELRDDFLARFNGHKAKTKPGPTSDFQRYLDVVVSAIYEEDAAGGNGGHEMVRSLQSTFIQMHPEGNFPSVNCYLEFRRQNVVASFVIAAAKFSIKSSVDSDDPRFARYLTLIADHLGIMNDLASYDKEARALATGETKDMINIVAVLQNLMSLPNDEAAKAATFSYLLQIEVWIIEEIEGLDIEENLTDEEWWFLEAVFLSASGNTFYSITTSRYGGETARISRMRL